MTRRPRQRDPEKRKAALLDAAIAVIAERGIDDTTHRLVAERADVPLGATTYYFPNLDALITAALEKSMRNGSAELSRWAAALAAEPSAATITELTNSYFANHDRAVIEWELYTAAARAAPLRALAEAWQAGLYEQLEPLVGGLRARAIAMLIDGAMSQALALGRPLDTEALEAGISDVLREG